MKQPLIKTILFSMLLTPSFFCASVPVEVKNEVFSRSDSSGAAAGEWHILSDEVPYKIVEKVGFAQPGSENKKLTEVGSENLGYIQSSGWENLNGTGHRWKFLKPEKMNGEILVIKKSNKNAIIKYNVNGRHLNKLYNEQPALIKICEINGKQYSYTQHKAEIDKLHIAHVESLPENIAKRVELKRLEESELAAQEEKAIIKKRAVEEEQKRYEAWESDSNTIFSMIKGLRNIEKVNPNDSDLQIKEKTEWRNYLYDEEFNRIKKKYYNKAYSLQAAMVKDVVPETRLNKEGQRKLREVESAIKNNNLTANYLANQFAKDKYKYEIETGQYEILLSIPVPDSSGYSRFNTGIKKAGSSELDRYETENRFNVNIILIVKSKNKALKYSKEEVIPLTGKVTEIKHGYAFMDEYIKIKLVE